MTQPNEVKIVIRAIKKDFEKVQGDLEKMRGRMLSQASLIKQKFDEESKAAAEATARQNALTKAYEQQQAALKSLGQTQRSLAGSDLTKALQEQQQALAKFSQTNQNLANAGFNQALQNIQQSGQQIQATAGQINQQWQLGVNHVNQLASSHQKLNALLAQQQGLVGNLNNIGANIATSNAIPQLSKQFIGLTAAQKEALEVRRGFLGRSLEMLARAEGLSFDEATEAIKRNRQALADLGKDFIAAGAIIGGFVAILGKAFEFGQQGAMMERLSEAGNDLARSYGVNLTEAVAKVKAASLETVSTQQALLSTNRALLLGVSRDADQLAKLMEIAAIRGRATGLDTVEAFDRITLGIGRLSTRILDDIGIVVDGETAYANYGEAIGKTADQLTEAEKRIALTNAIIADGNELLAATGGVLEDNATKIARLTTNFKDLGDSIKQSLAGPLANVATSLNVILFGFSDGLEIIRQHNREVFDTAETYQAYREEIERVARVQFFWAAGVQDITKYMLQVKDAILRTREAMNTSLVGKIFGVGANAISQPILDLIDSLGLMSEELFNAVRAAQPLEDSFMRIKAAQEAHLAIQAEYKDNLEQATEAMRDFKGTIDDVSISSAIETAITQMQTLGQVGPQEIDKIRLAFGLVDQSVLNFRNNIQAAMDGATLSVRTLSGALIGLLQAKLASLSKKFNEDLANLGSGGLGNNLKKLHQDLLDRLSDIQRDLGRKLEDIQRDLGDKLNDLDIDMQRKREDAARDHARSLIKIEEDYQRSLDRIRQRFELSRIRALIDLDARALFEAELQRDMDLQDAKKSADEKRQDELADYQRALEDLERYHRDREEDIRRDAERRAEDARRDAEERLRDAHEDYARRLKDQVSAGGASRKKLEDQYEKEKKLLLDQLATARDMLDGYYKSTASNLTKHGNEMEGKHKEINGKVGVALKEHHIDLLRKYDEHKSDVLGKINDKGKGTFDLERTWQAAALGAASTFFGQSLVALAAYIAEWNRLVRTKQNAGSPGGGGESGNDPDDSTKNPPPLPPDFDFSTAYAPRPSAMTMSDTVRTSSNQNVNVRVVLEVKGDNAFSRWLRDMTRQSAIDVVTDVLR